jgi:hypothetical protein
LTVVLEEGDENGPLSLLTFDGVVTETKSPLAIHCQNVAADGVVFSSRYQYRYQETRASPKELCGC